MIRLYLWRKENEQLDELEDEAAFVYAELRLLAPSEFC